MTFVKTNGEVWDLDVVDKGRSGIIFRLNLLRILKAPVIRSDDVNATEDEKFHNAFEKDNNVKFLEKEMTAFQRLGHSEYIVEWYALRPGGVIEMKYMPYGSLSRVLQSHRLSPQQRYSWILDIAYAVSYAHSQRVIHGDLATRNILIDENLSARLCDFTDAAVLSPDVDMSEAVQDGVSIHTDIFKFGSLFYEVITGRKFDFDPVQATPEGELFPFWPEVNQLPSVTDMDYGAIILKCWNQGFADIASVTAEIQAYGPSSATANIKRKVRAEEKLSYRF